MKAPLTSGLLLFELTRDYDILLPLMASAGIGSLIVELADRQEEKVKAQSSFTVNSQSPSTATKLPEQNNQQQSNLDNPVNDMKETDEVNPFTPLSPSTKYLFGRVMVFLRKLDTYQSLPLDDQG